MFLEQNTFPHSLRQDSGSHHNMRSTYTMCCCCGRELSNLRYLGAHDYGPPVISVDKLGYYELLAQKNVAFFCRKFMLENEWLVIYVWLSEFSPKQIFLKCLTSYSTLHWVLFRCHIYRDVWTPSWLLLRWSSDGNIIQKHVTWSKQLLVSMWQVSILSGFVQILDLKHFDAVMFLREHSLMALYRISTFGVCSALISTQSFFQFKCIFSRQFQPHV